MWTTLSLHVELSRPAVALVGALLLAAASLGSAGLRAADDVNTHAPLPSRAKPREVPREVERAPQPVEPKRLKVTRVEKTRDPATIKLAGGRFLKTAKAPIRIEITLSRPLDLALRATGPVLVLNGKRLPETRVVPDQPDTLVAFLADATQLKAENTVTVDWVGDSSMSPKQEVFKFKPEDIKK